MNDKPLSLFKLGNYSQAWVRPFYIQSDIWWGADAGEEYYPGRLQTIERLCGAGGKRIAPLAARTDVSHPGVTCMNNLKWVVRVESTNPR